jgi:predicted DsbA family dithiol-disulfide isomerase
MAEEAGLELGVRNHRYNGDLAHEAMLWARSVGADDAMHRAIFRAYFVDDRNIGSAEVLVELADGAGLNAPDLRRALDERQYRDEVQEQYAEAREIGVTAVPTFVAGGRALVGAHPYESFHQLMASAGVTRKGRAEA